MSGDTIIIASGTTLTETEIERLALAIERGMNRHRERYPEVRFRCQDVQPPAYDYITTDTFLQLWIYQTTLGNPITIAAKILLPNGQVSTQRWTFTPVVAITGDLFVLHLTEGFLLSLTATLFSEATVQRGDTYIKAGLQFSDDPTTPLFRILLQGYATTTCGLAWPDGKMEDSVSGQGMLQGVSLGNPPAGSDWSYALPNGLRARLIAAQSTLIASVVAANRLVQAALNAPLIDGFYQYGGTFVQLAGTTVVYTFAPLSLPSSATAAAGEMVATPPDARIPAGGEVYSNTIGLDAGDQWVNVVLSLETWIEA